MNLLDKTEKRISELKIGQKHNQVNIQREQKVIEKNHKKPMIIWAKALTK